jgi:acyl-CoA thioester hydrolase
MSLENFHVKLELRIDWSELDYFGHVNNVSFFKYIQASRVNYWDSIGLTQSHRETNIGPMLASCKCDFKRPLYYPGKITVGAKMDFIGKTSFGLFHCIFDDKGKIAAEARDVMVMYNFNSDEKVLFPTDLINKASILEGRKLSSGQK